MVKLLPSLIIIIGYECHIHFIINKETFELKITGILYNKLHIKLYIYIIYTLSSFTPPPKKKKSFYLDCLQFVKT